MTEISISGGDLKRALTIRISDGKAAEKKQPPKRKPVVKALMGRKKASPEKPAGLSSLFGPRDRAGVPFVRGTTEPYVG